MYDQAIQRIDEENAHDPQRELEGDIGYPKEMLYGLRMSKCLEWFAPDAPEHVKLAARAQHIRRWDIPRDTYPRDRKGYHLWRTKLYSHHADVTEKILREVGYDDETINRVRDLLMKKRIKKDPDMQLLEDVICLVFLQHYFDDFAEDHGDEKLITILQRTWAKMSDAGHEAALGLKLSDRASLLIERALAE